MKFKISETDIYFPFDMIYKEQYEYIKTLSSITTQKTNGIIEMPTGTGKTVSLFSYYLSYKIQNPEKLKKIIYCTRTISQLEKATEELKKVSDLLSKNGFIPPVCTVLSARKSLCINEEVRKFKERNKIDAECKKKIVYKISEKCDYYENYQEEFNNVFNKKNNNGNYKETYFEDKFEEDLTNKVNVGPRDENLNKIMSEKKISKNKTVFNIEDLLKFGDDNKMCPYYSARNISQSADIVICNYPYILDDKVNHIILKDLEKESVVIIDEAHNIDSVCIESKTIRLDKQVIDFAFKNLKELKEVYNERKIENFEAFEKEYKKLLMKLTKDQQNKMSSIEELQIMPGNIRKVTHFFSFLKRLLNFINNFLRQKEVLLYDPQTFLQLLKEETHIDEQALKFASARLNSLVHTLNFEKIENLIPLQMVLQFGETLQNPEGFKIIFEPFYDTGKTISPLLQLTCLDASLAMKDLLSTTNSVILTSGTISPMDLYSTILGIEKSINVSIEPKWIRNSINPLVVGRASDQSLLTSAFSERGNSIVSKNYGELLLDFSKYIPDGIVCFFPSYSYMEEIVTDWKKLGLIEEIIKNKLLFIETKDQNQTSEALQNYKNAIERGRGGIFLCVARGKVAEGVDFKNHLGRCAFVIGIPFQYTKSRALLCRTDFLEKKFGISQKEFVLFDAMKQTAQCLGRVVRGKMDYGIMVLADSRYNDDKISALPKWIKTFLKPENLKLQSNLAVQLVKRFFVEMTKQIEISKEIYYTQDDFN